MATACSRSLSLWNGVLDLLAVDAEQRGRIAVLGPFLGNLAERWRGQCVLPGLPTLHFNILNHVVEGLSFGFAIDEEHLEGVAGVHAVTRWLVHSSGPLLELGDVNAFVEAIKSEDSCRHLSIPSLVRPAVCWSVFSAVLQGIAGTPWLPRVRVKKRKRAPIGTSTTLDYRLRAQLRNYVWELDFEFDQTADCRTLKYLNITDEFTKKVLAIEV